jgi:hypothetical protein
MLEAVDEAGVAAGVLAAAEAAGLLLEHAEASTTTAEAISPA